MAGDGGGGGGLERGLKYTYEMTDNVTPTARAAEASASNLSRAIKETKDASTDQSIQFIKSISALNAVQGGLMGIDHALTRMGVLSDTQGKNFMRMLSGLQLFIGAAQGIKGVIALSNTLKGSQISLAAVETYRAILNNPAKAALVGIGLGSAAAVGGYLLGRSQGGGGGSTTTVKQTLYFSGGYHGADQRMMARSSLEAMGG
jgi:hypothetical protein